MSARASGKKVRRAGGKLRWLGDSDTGFALRPAGTAGKPLYVEGHQCDGPTASQGSPWQGTYAVNTYLSALACSCSVSVAAN